MHLGDDRVTGELLCTGAGKLGGHRQLSADLHITVTPINKPHATYGLKSGILSTFMSKRYIILTIWGIVRIANTTYPMGIIKSCLCFWKLNTVSKPSRRLPKRLARNIYVPGYGRTFGGTEAGAEVASVLPLFTGFEAVWTPSIDASSPFGFSVLYAAALGPCMSLCCSDFHMI